jgi:secreted trypsin-like serine protease
MARGRMINGHLSRWGVLIVAVLAGTAAVPSDAKASMSTHGALRSADAHTAVVGGQAAAPGTFPWMAYIRDARGDEEDRCSGTVVAPNLILTAAHCAENRQTGVLNDASGYQVVTGDVNWDAPTAERQVSGVARVIVCPCFDRRTDVGDVALLELSTPTSAPAVTLAADPPGGTGAFLAGWGQAYYNQASPSEQLQWAPTVVQDPERCEHEASPFGPASQICVLDTPGRQTGACAGDSGGPLLLPESSAVGGMVQIGVTDHVYGECSTTSPTVFTRVDVISAWVRGWATALAGAPPVSTPPPAETVAAPTLPGFASARSLTVAGDDLALVLSCDGEGGVCDGDVEASIRAREELVLRRGATRRVLDVRTRTVRLASISFAIAPGYSTAIRAALSPPGLRLLSRIGNGTLEVTLSGRGFSSRLVRLTGSR